jgi:hypothetical protein
MPDLTLGSPVALQLVSNNHAQHMRQALEELPEALLRRVFVPATLYQDIQDVAVLIDSAPEIVPLAVNGQKHLI